MYAIRSYYVFERIKNGLIFKYIDNKTMHKYFPRIICFALVLLSLSSSGQAIDGSQLWFTNQQLSVKVKTTFPTTICIQEESARNNFV